MDKIEAKRNIEHYEAEISKWQALSRGLMSRDEMMIVDKKITQLKEWSRNLRIALNGHSKIQSPNEQEAHQNKTKN